MKTIVQEVPKERCSLRAQPFCEFETKLVPVLKPVDNCVDVPKEVCVRMRTNPRKVKRPVIKKWCYVPTAESGLSNEDDYDQNENVDTDSTNSETSDNTEGSGAVVEEVPTDNPGSDSDEEESSPSDASTDDGNKDDSSSTSAKRRRRKNK